MLLSEYITQNSSFHLCVEKWDKTNFRDNQISECTPESHSMLQRGHLLNVVGVTFIYKACLKSTKNMVIY